MTPPRQANYNSYKSQPFKVVVSQLDIPTPALKIFHHLAPRAEDFLKSK